MKLKLCIDAEYFEKPINFVEQLLLIRFNIRDIQFDKFILPLPTYCWLNINDGRVIIYKLPLDNDINLGDSLSLLVDSALNDFDGYNLTVNLKKSDKISSDQAEILYTAPVIPDQSSGIIFRIGLSLYYLARRAYNEYYENNDEYDKEFFYELIDPVIKEFSVWPQNVELCINQFKLGLNADILDNFKELVIGLCRPISSMRNYNRFIRLKSDIRRNRLQAMRLFPWFIPGTLLTIHRHILIEEGYPKRYAWIKKDPILLKAIDTGKPLIPLLADRFGVNKSTIRFAIGRFDFQRTSLKAQFLLSLLDGMPPEKRPSTEDELILAEPVFRQLVHFGVAEQSDVIKRLGSEFFRDGIKKTIHRLQNRYQWQGDPLCDCRDFFDAAKSYVNQKINKKNRPFMGPHILETWIIKYGFWSFLDASERWHKAFALGHLRSADAADSQWIPLVGEQKKLHQFIAYELNNYTALEQEGKAMLHCVASRWRACTNDGARIFSLKNFEGRRCATLEFRTVLKYPEYCYSLTEIRGRGNRNASTPCYEAAQELLEWINRPEQLAVRQIINQPKNPMEELNRYINQTITLLDDYSRNCLDKLLKPIDDYALEQLKIIYRNPI